MKSYRGQISDFVKGVKDNEEVNLKSAINLFFAGKHIIYISLFVSLIVGLVRGLTSANEYTTTSKMLTEQQDLMARGGSLSSLIGLTTGRGMNMQTNVISPEFYPEIITTDDFLLKLISEEYYFEKEGKSLTLEEYFSKYEKKNWITLAIELPKRLLNVFNKPENGQTNIESVSQDSVYLRITNKQFSAIGKLRTRIDLSGASGIVTISTKMPDAKVSATLNKKIIDYLIAYVVGFQTDRERKNAEFIDNQLSAARKKYENAQIKLASFRDSNRGLILDVDRSQEQRLQSEYNLAFGVFDNLSQQSELAKIKLQESRPVVTIFQNPSLPLTPSEPSIIKSVLVFCFLGLFFALIFIGGKIILEFYKQA